MAIPSYDQLFNPVLEAMKRLGGSASIAELDAEVIKNLDLPADDVNRSHGQNGTTTELQYRLAWARTYLKIFGLLDNSGRGIWSLTSAGKQSKTVDPKAIQRYVRARPRKGARAAVPPSDDSLLDSAEGAESPDDLWRKNLLAEIQNLAPDAFERLCQRLLRESGFVKVEVTGRSGDGGIDGVGIVRIGGLLGFPVLFQCKRYRGSVSSGVIRDFRGAMIGRSDRGLVITTGTFTQDAQKEATRDGAPPIDLMNGEDLLDKLRELRLGVKVETIERISVLPEWFRDI